MAGGAGAEKLELTSADGAAFSAALAEAADRVRRPRGDHLARRPRPLPLLHRARRALRRRRPPRDRDRLLRPHGRHWASATRTSSTCRTSSRRARAGPGRRRRGPVGARRADRRDELRHGRLLLRRLQSFLAATSPELMLDGAVGFYGLPRRRALRDAARRSTTSARSAARSSASSAAPTRPSRRATSTRSTGCSRRPASSTRSSSTPARRTRSSTARSTEHEGACSDAWRRVVGFLEQGRRGAAPRTGVPLRQAWNAASRSASSRSARRRRAVEAVERLERRSGRRRTATCRRPRRRRGTSGPTAGSSC